MPAKPADADALPGAPADDARADGVDHAGDLVPRDAREGKVGPLPFDGETVAMANPAGFDADPDLARRGLGHFPFDQLERPARPCNLRRTHLRHYPLPIGGKMPLQVLGGPEWGRDRPASVGLQQA